MKRLVFITGNNVLIGRGKRHKENDVYLMCLKQYLFNLGEQGENLRVNFTDLSDDELYQIQTETIAELGTWNNLKHPEAV